MHRHCHIDVSYINISGTFHYLCGILDGCSRYIVNRDLRESMTEADIEIILERASELHPESRQGRIRGRGRYTTWLIVPGCAAFIRDTSQTASRPPHPAHFKETTRGCAEI